MRRDMSGVAKVREGICLGWQNYAKGYVGSGKSTRRDMSRVAKVCEGICRGWQKYAKGYVRSGKSM